jgi:hypothetical protein
MSEIPMAEQLATPDEVMIVTTEDFLQMMKDHFEKVPFVALNLTRSQTMSPADGEEGYTMATLVAVAFEREEITMVPGAMSMLTNHSPLVVGAEADDTDIQTMIDQELYAKVPGAMKVLEADVPQQLQSHPELPPGTTVMQF